MTKRPILIADPDTRVASLVAHGLRKEGFQVATAQRGEDALALLPSHPLLIFCEADLPGLDGLTLCQSAKKEPATHDVPFFFLSRRHDPILRTRAFAAGADDFLVKPVYARDACTLAHLFAGRDSSDALMEGELSALPLFYILRALTSGARSGQVETPDDKGTILFHDGHIIEASSEGLSGEAALARLLVLSQGPFAIKLGPVAQQGSMDYSLRDLVTVDEPRRKRFERAVALMGGADTRLMVNWNILAKELQHLPAHIEKIVRLFDGARTLREVLRVSDLDEVSAAESILHLHNQGILGEPKSPREKSRFADSPPDDVVSMNRLFSQVEPFSGVGRPRPTPHHLKYSADVLKPKREPQDLFALSNGGWFELPVALAGKHLRQVLGDLAAEDIERHLIGLDGPVNKPADNPASNIIAEHSVVDSRTSSSSTFDSSEKLFSQTASDKGGFRPVRLRRALLMAATLGTLTLTGLIALKVKNLIKTSTISATRSLPVGPAALPQPSIISSVEPLSTAPKQPPKPEEPASPSIQAEDAKAFLQRGQALYEAGQVEASLEPLESAAKLSSDADIQILLALARLDAHRPLLAERAAFRALQLEPRKARAYLVLGSIHQELGKLKQARKDYREYLKLSPRGEHAREVRTILDGMDRRH